EELERYRQSQRSAWREAKTSKDEILHQKGWDDPAKGMAIKEAEFNQVLIDWTTQDQVLNKGIAVYNERIINTKDALYTQPSWPGNGAFHAAQTRIGSGVVPKSWGNWMVLWGATMGFIVALAFKNKVRLPGRSRQI
ncbi:MAG: hypothetical protein L7S67_07875, partial [Flavobacteriales bacterium]|nr:hypothetical protein [Flavobacteriales bacterium]